MNPYIGYEMVEVKSKGPILKKAKYRLIIPLYLRKGLSNSHRAKLTKSKSIKPSS